MNRPRTNPGFTLVEVIVGVVIVALLGGATTLVLSRSIKTRDTLASRHEAFQRAQAAAEMIARDIANVARDNNLQMTRVRLTGGARSEVLLKTMGTRTVRPASPQNEGPVHEVQYRVDPVGDGQQALWKREDPFPDEYNDAGGVANPIVPGVVSIAVEAYDGASWTDQWDSDSDGYPHAVKVTVVAGGGTEGFVTTARQIVAIDRVPLPETPTTPTTDPAAPTQPTAPTPGNTTGQPPTTTGAGGQPTVGTPAGVGGGGGRPAGGGGGGRPAGGAPSGTPVTPPTGGRPTGGGGNGGGGTGGGGGQEPRG